LAGLGIGVRAARPDGVAVVLPLVVAFYAEDGFATPADVLRVNVSVLGVECGGSGGGGGRRG
jgi:hypothetical protein